jgi:hypothetical protein
VFKSVSNRTGISVDVIDADLPGSVPPNLSRFISPSLSNSVLKSHVLCPESQVLCPPTDETLLDIQVLHVQRILLDELPAALHVFAHQSRKDLFTGRNIFKLYLQQRASLRIHRRLP